jgi:hypothetical protein
MLLNTLHRFLRYFTRLQSEIGLESAIRHTNLFLSSHRSFVILSASEGSSAGQHENAVSQDTRPFRRCRFIGHIADSSAFGGFRDILFILLKALIAHIAKVSAFIM